MKILSSSNELKAAIQSLLLDDLEKRIIAVAYVGDNAISYLPSPKGIDLYCSVNIPGTNPNSLRTLKKNGVNVYEVKDLHSKIYWSESFGVIIGSANLSNNGLSENGNHEVGVLLPKGSFDVKKYVSTLESTEVDYARLNELEKIYNTYMLKNKRKPMNKNKKTPSFWEWNDLIDSEWRVYPWTIEGRLPKDVETKLKYTHSESEDYDFMQTESSKAYDIGGWVLNVKEIWKGDELIGAKELSWCVPELRIKSLQKNSQNLPFCWIQIGQHISAHEPFNLRDKKFQRAFESAYIELTNSDQKTTLKNNKPSQNFLRLLKTYDS